MQQWPDVFLKKIFKKKKEALTCDYEPRDRSLTENEFNASLEINPGLIKANIVERRRNESKTKLKTIRFASYHPNTKK